MSGPRPAHIRARELFEATYGSAPEGVVSAPGRVNLIGDHTDYTGGFVLPAALALETALAYRAHLGPTVRVVSEAFEGSAAFELGEEGVEGWAAYLAGVAWALQNAGHTLSGLELAIASDVPTGAGLSSSAALEVAAARVWREVDGLPLDDVAIARHGRRAENDYVGVPTGVMDQFSSSVPDIGQAILLDCRDLRYSLLDIPCGWSFVVTDSGASRSLASSAYRERVRECQEVATALGLVALRDLRLEHLIRLEGVLHKRARHIYYENERVGQAADAMRAGDIDSFGTLMSDSHRSLRDDYEVSSDALDALVRASSSFAGCYGARLTGAGFGGCTVQLLETGQEDAFVIHLAKAAPQAEVVAVVALPTSSRKDA